jgi:uncharacterized protein
MRFTQDSTSGINVIRSYAPRELRVNEETYRDTVILDASTVLTEPNVRQLDEIGGIETARILALQPELVLLGTGARQVFPAAAFGAQFLRQGIGFEVMDTGAACRTFNVLVGEQRRVVALLFL